MRNDALTVDVGHRSIGQDFDLDVLELDLVGGGR